MKQILGTILLLSTCIFAQENLDLNNDCPPHYTRSRLINPEITIEKVEVTDSGKYSTLPKFVGNIDSISKLIIYPEIAKRAGVGGQVIVKLKIDPTKEVPKAEIIKGIGAGCDEFVLDVLLNTKFISAKINDVDVESEFIIWVKFNLNEVIDGPGYIFDEITYEIKGYNYHKRLCFNKFGEAKHFEGTNDKKITEREGKIPIALYTKLSDFINSQCFLNYEDNYSNTTSSHSTRTIITVKTGSTEKSVWSYGYGSVPVGLWAIANVIFQLTSQVRWAYFPYLCPAKYFTHVSRYNFIPQNLRRLNLYLPDFSLSNSSLNTSNG
jgi:TonB family protein